ncbi:methyl-accepting chemotaxis protein [Bdellovibrio bacteriovorus]|uniref:methyl-accepting chemotaxis protein n=1 Tax=Bdellovibrio bacteriovorus TaxID=959 RepID=UPI003CFE6A2B
MKAWFKGIRGRLLAVALLPVVGFSVASWVSFDGISRVGSLLDSAHDQIIPSTTALDRLIIARNRYGYSIFVALSSTDNPELKKERLEIAREAIRDWRTNFEIYQKNPIHSEQEKESRQFIEQNKDHYLGLLEKAIALVESGKPEELTEARALLLGEVWQLGTLIGKNNQTIAKTYEERARQEGLESESLQKSVYLWTGIINTTASIVIISIILLISNRIARGISLIADRLSSASGDVTSSVSQLSEAGNTLSQSSTEAAASLEETVASLEELTSMVQVNADNARQAAAMSASSRESAEAGEREIRGLIESMSEISKSSKKIEEIISVIDDIAFQTNLLALNAAVEAARAGEQGKGFAVVAEAVRSLAQRSAVAAKDITVLIKASVEQVEQGSVVADNSGVVLKNIVESVKKVADLNNEIAAASVEQSAGIAQIGKAMNQLDQASQSNAASAEEVAASSGEIGGLAGVTQQLTVDLNTMVLGA